MTDGKSCSFLGGPFTDPGVVLLGFFLCHLTFCPLTSHHSLREKCTNQPPNQPTRKLLSGWKSQYFGGMEHPASYSSIGVKAQSEVLVEQGPNHFISCWGMLLLQTWLFPDRYCSKTVAPTKNQNTKKSNQPSLTKGKIKDGKHPIWA